MKQTVGDRNENQKRMKNGNGNHFNTKREENNVSGEDRKRVKKVDQLKMEISKPNYNLETKKKIKSNFKTNGK